MPNSGNRNNGGNKNSGEGSPRHRTSRTSSQKNNTERSDIKHENHPKQHKGDTAGLLTGDEKRHLVVV